MSKGIIILNEIPEKCDQCLVRHPGLAYCQITQKSTSHSSTGKPLSEKKRPDWCPVRPMPGRACHEDYCDNGRYDKGWNDCLKTILKGGGAE